jgi:hypothetical protein
VPGGPSWERGVTGGAAGGAALQEVVKRSRRATPSAWRFAPLSSRSRQSTVAPALISWGRVQGRRRPRWRRQELPPAGGHGGVRTGHEGDIVAGARGGADLGQTEGQAWHRRAARTASAARRLDAGHPLATPTAARRGGRRVVRPGVRPAAGAAVAETDLGVLLAPPPLTTRG